MRTHIGKIAAVLLQEMQRSSIGYDDRDLLEQIAILANLSDGPHRNAIVLQAIGRDDRFTRDFKHLPIGGIERRIRVFHLTTPQIPEPPPVELPADPWQRRLFVGTLLDLDPHDVTPSHAAAVAPLLPAAMQRLTRTQRRRICAAYGIGGVAHQTVPQQAADAARKYVTVRNSIRVGMGNLAAYIQERMAPPAPSAPVGALPGDALFWERVNRSGACWIWRGAISYGSPTFKRNGKKRQARRYVYELFIGPIPLEHRVVTTCGEERCVRPEHLEAIHASEAFGRSGDSAARQS